MRGFRNLALGVALLFMTDLASVARNVKSDYDHNVDFSRIHTYSWGKIATLDPVYSERIKSTVDKDLQGKGFQFLTSGGDVTIFARSNVHSRQELEAFYKGFSGRVAQWGWGGWAGGACGEASANPGPGKLVIDVFDGNSRTLLWRGCADEGQPASPDKNAPDAGSDLESMLKTLPPDKSR